jgi:hypothetical protein
MAFQFDPNSYDENGGFGSGGAPEPGDYHVQLLSAVDLENDAGVRLKFQVVSPGPNHGRTVTETLWFASSDGDPDKTRSCENRVKGFATRLRLITPKQIEEAREKGEYIDIDFVNNGGGLQAILKVERNEYSDKKTGALKVGIRVPFEGIFDLEDPRYLHVPLDPDLAALADIDLAARHKAHGEKLAAEEKASAAKASPKRGAGRPANSTASKPASPQQPAASQANPAKSNGAPAPSSMWDKM